MQEQTSNDIRVMDLVSKIAELQRKLDEKEQAPKVYERHNEVARYIVAQYEEGKLTEEQAETFSRLLDVALVRTVGVEVDVRFTLEMDLPYNVTKEEAIKAIEFHAFGIDDVRTLGTKLLDTNNVRI